MGPSLCRYYLCRIFAVFHNLVLVHVASKSRLQARRPTTTMRRGGQSHGPGLPRRLHSKIPSCGILPTHLFLCHKNFSLVNMRRWRLTCKHLNFIITNVSTRTLKILTHLSARLVTANQTQTHGRHARTSLRRKAVYDDLIFFFYKTYDFQRSLMTGTRNPKQKAPMSRTLGAWK